MEVPWNISPDYAAMRAGIGRAQVQTRWRGFSRWRTDAITDRDRTSSLMYSASDCDRLALFHQAIFFVTDKGGESAGLVIDSERGERVNIVFDVVAQSYCALSRPT